MKLSEELLWRGFCAKTTVEQPSDLDQRPSKKFYLGVDPSADSMTIGNLASLMMSACFVRHGYQPYLLVGGATGQIGDPKDHVERELKPLSEIAHNKARIAKQLQSIIRSDQLTLLDNLDWFRDLKYLDFLREIGKVFSMTQLLDRQFVKNRIGLDGAGLSYAEFSYTLIQGYDFLHLYRTYGIDLQLCGADQYGNCASGIHLIKRLEGAVADVWSAPLVIDPLTGVKFGKSENNAIWLDADKTPIFDFYQFWLNQPDAAVEQLLKFYTIYDKAYLDDLLVRSAAAPERRLAQKALAFGVTEVVHGTDSATAVAALTDLLFPSSASPAFPQPTPASPQPTDSPASPQPTSDSAPASHRTPTPEQLAPFTQFLPTVAVGTSIVEALLGGGFASGKTAAQQLLKAGAVSVNGIKITADTPLSTPGILKKGKNKFMIIK